MPDAAVKYAVEVHKKFKVYWPAWTPTDRVAIGDYGELWEDVFFHRLGHVSECGISEDALRPRRATGHDNLVFKSKGTVRVSVQADAANAIPGLSVPPGRAGGRIAFTRADAAFLAAVGVKARGLRSEQRLRDELKAKVEEGLFQPEYVVVTDVLHAESGRAFISSAAGQSVKFHAVAALGVGPVELASVGGRTSVATESEDMLGFDGTRGMTPLFKIMGFKVGKQIRDWLKTIFRGSDLPRIRVDAIHAAPRVGSPLVVSPLASQRLLFAPTGMRPFFVEPTGFRPFTVEPTLIDPGTLGLLFPQRALARSVEATAVRGPLLGMVEGDPVAGGEIVVRLFGSSPVVIEPLDSDPFLVNLPQSESLTFEPAEVEFVEGSIPSSAPAQEEDDPFSFGYVDFDEELAAAATQILG